MNYLINYTYQTQSSQVKCNSNNKINVVHNSEKFQYSSRESNLPAS
jgi:hypothetical protein